MSGDIFQGVDVAISGIHDEDEDARSIVHDEVSRVLGKLVKVMDVAGLSLHVRKYHKDGKRAKYSVHGKLLSGDGEFFAEDFAWDLALAVKGVLVKMEKELVRHAEREKDRTGS